MEHFVHALYPDRQAAAKAVNALVNANFPPTEIGALVANDQLKIEELGIARKTVVTAGVIIGMFLGGLGGLLVLSALGLVSPAAPGDAAAGIAAGAAFGIFAGGLGGLGYWRYVIDFPRRAFTNATILIGVATNRGRVDAARLVLTAAGAQRTHVSSKTGAAARALAWARNNPEFHAAQTQGW